MSISTNFRSVSISSRCVTLLVLSLSLSLLPSLTLAGKPKWIRGRITWYGDTNGEGTTSGGCGYGNTYARGYNLDTGAASGTLWSDGLSCGACFAVKCRSHSACNGKTTVVTITNSCPSNWALDPNHGGWCNPPNRHIDMTYLSFSKVANPNAGVVPAFLRRVPCQRSGGIIFSVYGNPWFLMVLVSNVAGSGDIGQMAFRIPGQDWISLTHNYGAIWTASGGGYYGNAITVRIKSKFTREKLVINNAIPGSWNFGGDYKSNGNFKGF